MIVDGDNSSEQSREVQESGYRAPSSLSPPSSSSLSSSSSSSSSASSSSPSNSDSDSESDDEVITLDEPQAKVEQSITGTLWRRWPIQAIRECDEEEIALHEIHNEAGDDADVAQQAQGRQEKQVGLKICEMEPKGMQGKMDFYLRYAMETGVDLEEKPEEESLSEESLMQQVKMLEKQITIQETNSSNVGAHTQSADDDSKNLDAESLVPDNAVFQSRVDLHHTGQEARCGNLKPIDLLEQITELKAGAENALSRDNSYNVDADTQSADDNSKNLDTESLVPDNAVFQSRVDLHHTGQEARSGNLKPIDLLEQITELKAGAENALSRLIDHMDFVKQNRIDEREKLKQSSNGQNSEKMNASCPRQDNAAFQPQVDFQHSTEDPLDGESVQDSNNSKVDDHLQFYGANSKKLNAEFPVQEDSFIMMNEIGRMMNEIGRLEEKSSFDRDNAMFVCNVPSTGIAEKSSFVSEPRVDQMHARPSSIPASAPCSPRVDPCARRSSFPTSAPHSPRIDPYASRSSFPASAPHSPRIDPRAWPSSMPASTACSPRHHHRSLSSGSLGLSSSAKGFPVPTSPTLLFRRAASPHGSPSVAIVGSFVSKPFKSSATCTLSSSASMPVISNPGFDQSLAPFSKPTATSTAEEKLVVSAIMPQLGLPAVVQIPKSAPVLVHGVTRVLQPCTHHNTVRAQPISNSSIF